jgi:Cd2+/Zn2+-exporting ATPase
LRIDTRYFDLALALPHALNCELCVGRLVEALRQQAGVLSVELTPERDKIVVAYDPSAFSGEQVVAAVGAAGAGISRRYRHKQLTLTEMDCPDCAQTVEAALAHTPGILSARVEFALGRLDLAYDAERIRHDEIVARIRCLGYDVAEAEPATLRFRIEGLDCAECVQGLEKAVESLPGVARAEISFAAGTMAVSVEGDGDLIDAITHTVAEAGYTARLEAGEAAKPPPRRGFWPFVLTQRRGRRTLASGALLLLGVLFDLLPLHPVVSIVFYAAAIVIGGFDVARNAVATLRTTRNIDLNLLLTVAVIGAAAIGQWAEGAVVIVLFSLGSTLEAFTLDRTRDAVRALIELSPQEATLIRDQGEERVRVEALQVGDRVRVRPGERIPADGEVIEGSSAVDESSITGEAIPADKEPGDQVYAGTVLGYGALVVRIARPVSDSTLARIVRLVEQAQAQKAPSQRFVDRFAGVYTPVVITVAAAIAVMPPLIAGEPIVPWVYRALVLLVIACPCALVISTPVAVVSALGRAAHEGVLIKGGTYLEAAGGLRAIAFDKTRTLTAGRPVVTDVIPLDNRSEEELLSLAAAIERNSEHPLAQAVVREARHRRLSPAPASDFQALPGRGARGRVDGTPLMIGNRALLGQCLTFPAETDELLLRLEEQGKTVFVLGRCDYDSGGGTTPSLLGAIAVADAVRPESQPAIRALRDAGLKQIVMITGDNLATAGAIGRQVGVDLVRANLLPEHKVEVVESLLAEYGAVGVVGDGVNDAPALARATVGIAMGAAGTDAALETADIALMGDDLTKVPFTLRLSRRTLAIIRQNIALSLLIKAAFVALAVAGIATLWAAVFADVGTSLIVILNGMRLARR